MNKRFMIILLVIVLGFVGIFWFSKNNNKTSDTASQTGTSNHTIGNNSKGITLVEYGDFQCPACGAVEPIIQQVREKYKDQIVFQFSHFPLTQIHPNAMAAHKAAEAAGNQGKFWEMHDLLYQTQEQWKDSPNVSQFFEDIATQIGLNIDVYKVDVTSVEVNNVIDADIKAAQRIGATGTPTYVLDGVKITDNLNSLEAFTKLIDEAIAKKSNQ